MNSEPNKQGSWQTAPGLLIVALIGLGIIVQQLPLQSSRPPEAEVNRNRFPYLQYVDARLWQDPFSAVVDFRERNLAAERAKDPTRLDNLTAAIEKACRNPETQVVGALASGGPYSEYAEQRRRIRYAVVSGLAALSYFPDNAEQLGYLTFEPQYRTPDRRLPRIVPYEWFNRESPSPTNVLVLWLDEGVFESRPLERLAELASALTLTKACANRPLKLIGPFGSSMLGAVLNSKAGANASATPFEFYVNGATAAFDTEQPAGQSRADFKIVRAVATDEVLAGLLKTELQRRGVQLGKDRVSFVSETETLYGRKLCKTMTQHSAACESDSDAFRFYSYLRGLDGEKPRLARPPDDNGPAKTKDDRAQRPGAFELAAGTGQLDYLRRLADAIKNENAHERESGSGIKAVGILGTDYYDKLLILQALREVLPDALFFTTDLDARMLDPGSWKWTRNLIVASSFGLSLHPALQRGAAPFRDTYQTATYLATLAALTYASGNGPLLDRLTGRVFEIGRTQAFDFGPERADPTVSGNDCSPSKLAACPTLYPPPNPMFGIPGNQWRRLAGIAILAIALLLATFWSIRRLAIFSCVRVWRPLRTIGRLHPPAPGDFALLVGALLAGGLAIYVVTQAIADVRDGEPFAWAEGISVWPTVILRFLAGLLSVYFLARAWSDGKRNMQQLADDFPGMDGVAAPKRCPLTILRWRAMGTRNDATDCVADLLGEYSALGRPRRRALRILPLVAIYVMLSGLLIAFFGEPLIPFRGGASLFAVKATLWFAILAFCTLLFYVVDATRLLEALTDRLCFRDSRYPEPTVQKFARRFGIDDTLVRNYLDEWLDIQFIARHSECVSHLIYYPFIVLAILLLARSPLIDNWTTPPSIGLVLLIAFSYACFCAMRLRFTAEQARSRSIEWMTEHLVQARSDARVSEKTMQQIELLLEQVASLRRGAFLPWAQQPIIKAVLIPLGSFGGIETLQYLLFALR